jgi:hypothetical protein
MIYLPGYGAGGSPSPIDPLVVSLRFVFYLIRQRLGGATKQTDEMASSELLVNPYPFDDVFSELEATIHRMMVYGALRQALQQLAHF